MIKFQEIYSVEKCALRYYVGGDESDYRFIPIERNYKTRSIYGYVVTPSGIVFPDNFEIFDQYDVEFIIWYAPDHSVYVIFDADKEQFFKF